MPENIFISSNIKKYQIIKDGLVIGSNAFYSLYDADYRINGNIIYFIDSNISLKWRDVELLQTVYSVFYDNEYSKTGSLKIVLDKDAPEKEYAIGYDDNFVLSGFQNVNICGYMNADNKIKINGNITGGIWEKDSFVSSGSIILQNSITVNGVISGYKNVKLYNNIVCKDIDNGEDKIQKSIKRFRRNHDSGSGRPYNVYSDKYIKSGNLIVRNSNVGKIKNYKSVKLINTSALDIELNTLNVIKKEKLFYYDDDDGWVEEDFFRDVYYIYESVGTLDIKLTEDALTNLSVGNISGYKTVNISGYTDKKNSMNDLYITAGNITSGNKENDGYFNKFGEFYIYTSLEEVCGTLKLDHVIVDSIYGFKNINAKNTVFNYDVVAVYTDYVNSYNYLEKKKDYCGYSSIKYMSNYFYDKYKLALKPAGSFAIVNSEMKGNIYTYKNINIKNSKVYGDIDFGKMFSFYYQERVYGYDIKFSYKVDTSGQVTIKDSEVADIKNYGKITLVNTDAGNILRDFLVSVEDKSLYKRYDDDKDHKFLGKVSGTASYSAIGSLSVTVNAASTKNVFNIGRISGYKNVTINGYSYKDKEKYIIISGDILAGKYQYFYNTTHDTMETPLFDIDRENFYAIKPIDNFQSFGTLNLKNNVYVDGDLSGFYEIKLKNSVIKGSIQNVWSGLNIDTNGKIAKMNGGGENADGTNYIMVQYQIADKRVMRDGKYYSGTYTETETVGFAASVSVTDSEVEKDIKGYKEVALTRAKVGGTVDFGIAYTKTYKETYKNGKLTESRSIKYVDNCSLSAVDSEIGGIVNYNSVKLSGSTVENNVENVTELTISKGVNSINGTYTGNNKNNTLTISNGAVLRVGGIDLGVESEDKLNISGTLLLTDDSDIRAAQISGQGEIVADSDHFEVISSMKFGKVYNLGETAENFCGTFSENADDSYKKAVKWNGEDEYCGWLGSWSNSSMELVGSDNIDHVKVKLDFSTDIIVSGDVEYRVLDKKGREIDLAALCAPAECILEITKDKENTASLSYFIELN